jgi:hypothetical protein
MFHEDEVGVAVTIRMSRVKFHRHPSIPESRRSVTMREPEHSHSIRGARVDGAEAGESRMHFHVTSVGITEPSPNRPGHRHRLPSGQWTAGSVERWSSRGVARM